MLYPRLVLRALLLLVLLCCGSLAQAPVTSRSVNLTREAPPSAGVLRAMRALPAGVTTTLLVSDVQTGQVLESLHPDQPMIPASATKTVTGAAVLIDRGGAGGWWSTELTVPASQSGQASVKALTLRGSADPTLSVSDGENSLRSLAKQAYARGIRTVGQVRLDETRLNAGSFEKTVLGWPMPAVRLREWDARPPRSAQEARERLGAAMIAQLRQAGIRVQSDVVGTAPMYKPYVPPLRQDKEGQPLPPDPVIPPSRRPEQGVASVRSGSVVPFVWGVLRPSDNEDAEQLLATLAAQPAGKGNLTGALAREKAILRELGVDLTGMALEDGSGLGRGNQLSARALSQLLKLMYDLPYSVGQPGLPATLYRDRKNAFVEALPQAGTGENLPNHGGRGGTMSLRLVSSGLDVRAKTGTLPGVSALTGYVTARSGRLLSFAILMNGPETSPLLTLRAVQDDMVQALARAH